MYTNSTRETRDNDKFNQRITKGRRRIAEDVDADDAPKRQISPSDSI